MLIIEMNEWMALAIYWLPTTRKRVDYKYNKEVILCVLLWKCNTSDEMRPTVKWTIVITNCDLEFEQNKCDYQFTHYR